MPPLSVRNERNNKKQTRKPHSQKASSPTINLFSRLCSPQIDPGCCSSNFVVSKAVNTWTSSLGSASGNLLWTDYCIREGFSELTEKPLYVFQLAVFGIEKRTIPWGLVPHKNSHFTSLLCPFAFRNDVCFSFKLNTASDSAYTELFYFPGGTVGDFTTLALISSALPALFLIFFSFMPESPVFLINRGDIHEARNALQWFRGKDYDIEDDLRQIRDGILEANANKAKVTDFLSCRATKRAMIISLGLMVFQQLSGINAVLFYAGKIFGETGGNVSPDVCAMLIGLVQVIKTFN